MPKSSRKTSYTLEEAAFAHRTGRAVPHGAGPHLFLAEDEQVLRSLMHMNLAVAGYRVTPFGHGADLLRAIERTAGTIHAPDLVIAETHLPGVLGLEVLEAVRFGPAWRTPFVILAAAEERDLVERAYRLGAQSVLEKPFEIRALVREVNALAEPSNTLYAVENDARS